jgi:LacI family transcriptional regulator
MHIVARMPLPASLSMEKVARLAGVSRSTVSRALRNDPRITAETRERVNKVAQESGYRPNPFVSTLMADLKRRRQPRSTSTLAFVTGHPSREGWRRLNPSFVDYFEGARERAASQGFILEPFWLREPGMTADRFTRMLYTRNILGLVIPPLPRPLGHLSLDWTRFAAIAIGYTLQRPDLSRSVTNFYQSMRLALRRVARAGYRRIGFVTDASTDLRVQHAWLAAYLVFQSTLTRPYRLTPLVCEQAKGPALAEWMRTQRPHAIIGAHNGIFTWLKQSSFSVPEDVAFASLNTGRDETDPAGIVQQARLVGANAIDQLLGQLHRNERGIPACPTITMVPGYWTEGPTLAGEEPRAKPSARKVAK